MSAATIAQWSDYRDWHADHATAREAIERSPHRESFLAALAKFTAKASQHERVSVMWWHSPYIYITVTDTRLDYPVNARALVSFDLANGEFSSHGSRNRYAFARRGWCTFVAGIIHYTPTVYSEAPTKVAATS
jgi:hypothetical protein